MTQASSSLPPLGRPDAFPDSRGNIQMPNLDIVGIWRMNKQIKDIHPFTLSPTLAPSLPFLVLFISGF